MIKNNHCSPTDDQTAIVSDAESATATGSFFHDESHHTIQQSSIRTTHHELRLVEMYLVHGSLASVTTNLSYAGRNILQNATDFVFRYLQICLRWTARQIRQAIAALWRALRITDLLHSSYLILLRILTLCGIALAIAVGVTTTVHIGYWGLPKL